jgi:hypothetical protein
MNKATISAADFDRLVDEGKEDVVQYLDLENARRGDPGTKRINIDLPIEFLIELDRESVRRGITRQSLIKVWLFDRLHGGPQSVIDLLGLVNKKGVIVPKEWTVALGSQQAAIDRLRSQEPVKAKRKGRGRADTCPVHNPGGRQSSRRSKELKK